MKKYIIVTITIIGAILLMFGSYYIYSTNNNTQDNAENLKSKVNEEMEYLNTTIISMLNQFNNISYTNYKITESEEVTSKDSQKQSGNSGSQGSQSGQQDSKSSEGESESSSNTITNIDINYSSILVNNNNNIQWDSIKKDVEEIYSSWTTILIDLTTLNVNKDNLLRFTTILDSVTQAVQKNDKIASMKNLSDLYSLLVLYVKDYSDDSKFIQLFETKSNILYSYTLAEYDDKWNEMKIFIQNAQNSYSVIMNSQINTIDINNINKVYILLNELSKSTDTKDKNIFYINYKNLMQEIEII